MKVAIIDFREDRGERLKKLVELTGADVSAVVTGADLEEAAPPPDLLLLHVGPEQEGVGSIQEDLDRFRPHSWILCYSGTQPVSAATACKATTVSVFPASVAMNDPGQDFTRTVQKVLTLLPQQATLQEDWFRSAVTGFDVVLEAKLDVLLSALKGDQPPPDRLAKIRKICPAAFDDKGELRVDARNRLDSVARLRRLFFHEPSLTADA